MECNAGFAFTTRTKLMNQRTQTNNAAALLALILLLAIGVVYTAIRDFSSAIAVPTEVGFTIMVRSMVAVAFAALFGWIVVRWHPRGLIVSALVLLAGLSVALWPALDIWAAQIPVFALVPGMGGEMALEWWGGWTARLTVLGLLAGAAVWQYVDHNY